MRDLIAALPSQLRWASTLDVPPVPTANEALVAGMGGSGMAGDVARIVAGSLDRQVTVHKGYGLPGWVSHRAPLVVAVSHSGDTEETVSSLAAATDAALPSVVVAAGGALETLAIDAAVPFVPVPPGPQPRAAIGVLAGAVLRVLEAAGVVGSQSEGLVEAAATVEQLLEGPGPALAEDLADALFNRIAIIYGGEGVSGVASGRWKTQINENGKAPAYASNLPELDHNEVVGWEAYPELSKDAVGVVFLRDPHDHPRVLRRFDVTRELMEDNVGIAGEVQAIGEGVLSRLFSLMVIGDLVSVSIAERAGVDPMPVEVLAKLKDRLKDDS